MKTLLSRQISNSLEGKFNSDESKPLSLVDLVRKDAERYCSEEEALEALNTIRNFVENYQYSSGLVDLYDISSNLESDYKSISEYDDSIGKWLKDNNNYFSKVTY